VTKYSVALPSCGGRRSRRIAPMPNTHM